MDLINAAPGAYVNINEESTLPLPPGSFAVGVSGITTMGPVNEPQVIPNAERFREVFGGYHPDNNFVLKCMRLLSAGVKLVVNRIGHYPTITDPLSLTGSKATFTLSVSSDSLVVNARHVGAGYNGTQVAITAAESGQANLYDITVTTPLGYTETLRDVEQAPSVERLAELNERLQYVELGTLTGNLPVASGTLTGGEQDVSEIVEQDYIGDSGAKNGWYAFAPVEDIFRMANIAIASPDVDVALAQYAQARAAAGMPVRFHIAAPATAQAQAQLDYRLGQGIYNHSAIDTYLGSMVGSGFRITDPTDTKRRLNISALVDVLIRQAQKDENEGPWFSAAGYDRGRITTPNNGLLYNAGATDEADNFKELNKNGINQVIERNGSFYYFGNTTLLRNRSKLLSKENIADLAVFIQREFKPILETVNFEPNDPPSWKALYRRARLLIDELVTRRAIFPGEGVNWAWVGDQDAQGVQDVQYNKLSDINLGIYKVRFIFTPISAIEKVALDATITDSTTVQFMLNAA